VEEKGVINLPSEAENRRAVLHVASTSNGNMTIDVTAYSRKFVLPNPVYLRFLAESKELYFV